MTISELIWAEINEIRNQKDNWDACYLSEKLISLTSLHASLTQHIAEMENAYHKLLQLTLESHTDIKFNRAESLCKASDEYLKYKKAVNLEKSLIEEIRAIKKYISIREREQQISNYV